MTRYIALLFLVACAGLTDADVLGVSTFCVTELTLDH